MIRPDVATLRVASRTRGSGRLAECWMSNSERECISISQLPEGVRDVNTHNKKREKKATPVNNK